MDNQTTQKPKRTILNNISCASLALLAISMLLFILGNIQIVYMVLIDGMWNSEFFGTLVMGATSAGLYLILFIITCINANKARTLDPIPAQKAVNKTLLIYAIFNLLVAAQNMFWTQGCKFQWMHSNYYLFPIILHLILTIIAIVASIKMKKAKEVTDKGAAGTTYAVAIGYAVAAIIMIALMKDSIHAGRENPDPLGPVSASLAAGPSFFAYIIMAISGILAIADAALYGKAAFKKAHKSVDDEDDPELQEARRLDAEEAKGASTSSTSTTASQPSYGNVDLSNVPEEYRELVRKDKTPVTYFDFSAAKKLTPTELDQTLNQFGPEVKSLVLKEMTDFATFAVEKKKEGKINDAVQIGNYYIVRNGLSKIMRTIVNAKDMDLSITNKTPINGGLYQKTYSEAEKNKVFDNQTKAEKEYTNALLGLLMDGMGLFEEGHTPTPEEINKAIVTYGLTPTLDIMFGIEREGAEAPKAEQVEDKDLLTKDYTPGIDFDSTSLNQTTLMMKLNAYQDQSIRDALLKELTECLTKAKQYSDQFGGLKKVNLINSYIVFHGMSKGLASMLGVQRMDLAKRDHRKVVGQQEALTPDKIIELQKTQTAEETHELDVEMNLFNFFMSMDDVKDLSFIEKGNKFAEKYGMSQFLGDAMGYTREGGHHEIEDDDDERSSEEEADALARALSGMGSQPEPQVDRLTRTKLPGFYINPNSNISNNLGEINALPDDKKEQVLKEITEINQMKANIEKETKFQGLQALNICIHQLGMSQIVADVLEIERIDLSRRHRGPFTSHVEQPEDLGETTKDFTDKQRTMVLNELAFMEYLQLIKWSNDTDLLSFRNRFAKEFGLSDELVKILHMK